MKNVHKSAAPINSSSNSTSNSSPNSSTKRPSDSLPPDFLFELRNKLLEACALAGAAADEVGALSPDVIDETVQALINVMERTCREALSLVEERQAASQGA